VKLYTLDNKIIVENSCVIPDNFTGIVELSDGTKFYYELGDLHRENGPAVIRADGSETWYIRNKKHRLGGPANICANGTLEWWFDNQYHNLYGPAIIYANGTREWRIVGEYVLEEDFEYSSNLYLSGRWYS
jgi:hypothetical protein